MLAVSHADISADISQELEDPIITTPHKDKAMKKMKSEIVLGCLFGACRVKNPKKETTHGGIIRWRD